MGARVRAGTNAAAVFLLVVLAGATTAEDVMAGEAQRGRKARLEHRWFMVGHGGGYDLRTDDGLDRLANLVRAAGEHGLNGMVVAFSVVPAKDSPEYLERLLKLREICDEHGVEIIPKIFSAGYGGRVLSQDRNLAPGQLVKDALFVVKGTEARLVPDPPVEITGGGFEDYEGNRVRGYEFHDRPGEVSFVDTDVRKEGKASLRFDVSPGLHSRVLKKLRLKPRRSYRASVWVKTRDLRPERAHFRMQLYLPRGRREGDAALIRSTSPLIGGTTDWTKVYMAINSQGNDELDLYLGVWGGTGGSFWVDDLRVEEVGLLNVLRRPGTPVTVRSERTRRVYRELRDYARVEDPGLDFDVDREPLPIRLVPRSRIREGERLRVTYYHGVRPHAVGLCMSEPKVYEIWEKQARAIHEFLAPKTYLLSMDEIRAGGTCKACRDRGMSMAEILGDCLTRQFNMLRRLNPKAMVCVWDDMLNPRHNARNGYMLVEGDYRGSWNHVPKEMVMVSWNYKIAEKSLRHFSGLGFRTIAADYYDADNLDRTETWLDALDRHRGGIGIMYTTWRGKFGLLVPWAKRVATHQE